MSMCCRFLVSRDNAMKGIADEAGQSVTVFLIEAMNDKINRIEYTREKPLEK